MRIRCIWVILAVLLVPATAGAHGHNADSWAALSFDFSSALVGGHGQQGITFPRPDSRNLGLLLDVTIHHGEHEGTDRTRVGFMGGVRYMFDQGRYPMLVPTAHVLVGLQHDAGPAGFKTEPAIAVGGSLDFEFNRRPQGWGARFLVDYVFSDVDSFPRISGGLVYRFGPQRTQP